MRSIFGSALFATLIFALGFGYFFIEPVCDTPIHYTLGSLDERFQLSRDEAKAAVAEAVTIWEATTGRDLFIEDEAKAELTINFIFDERQSLENSERLFAAELEKTRDANEALTMAYDTLVAKYEAAIATYESAQATFTADQQTYNDTVARYNREGGAPPDEYERLETERQRLEREASRLNREADKLNGYVADINELSERGSELVAAYNADVERYNRQFGTTREFTQGDYQGHEIHIYTYASHDELVAVLAHELGHALSLGHVENTQSIMYYLMHDQVDSLTLTAEDEAAFAATCDVPLWQRYLTPLLHPLG